MARKTLIALFAVNVASTSISVPGPAKVFGCPAKSRLKIRPLATRACSKVAHEAHVLGALSVRDGHMAARPGRRCAISRGHQTPQDKQRHCRRAQEQTGTAQAHGPRGLGRDACRTLSPPSSRMQGPPQCGRLYRLHRLGTLSPHAQETAAEPSGPALRALDTHLRGRRCGGRALSATVGLRKHASGCDHTRMFAVPKMVTPCPGQPPQPV